jgi:hypothetical protein
MVIGHAVLAEFRETAGKRLSRQILAVHTCKSSVFQPLHYRTSFNDCLLGIEGRVLLSPAVHDTVSLLSCQVASAIAHMSTALDSRSDSTFFLRKRGCNPWRTDICTASHASVRTSLAKGLSELSAVLVNSRDARYINTPDTNKISQSLLPVSSQCSAAAEFFSHALLLLWRIQSRDRRLSSTQASPQSTTLACAASQLHHVVETTVITLL